jgi:hypothetical protein
MGALVYSCAKKVHVTQTPTLGQPAGPTPVSANGVLMFTGTLYPGVGVGSVGDYFINVSDNVLYGPRADSGWGKGDTLNGTTGVASGAVSNLFIDAGAPPLGLGDVGDFYMDPTGRLLYGPKTSSSWGNAVYIQADTTAQSSATGRN